MAELLFRDDAYRSECEATVTAVGEHGVELDRTVFYPTGGGQPGDCGILTFADGSSLAIGEARKGETADAVRHLPADGAAALPAAGARVVARIDWARRHRLMRMHTCLHLLSAVLPFPVTGGQVADGKGRLDFDMANMPYDKDEVTDRLNRLIAADHPVAARWITDAELAASPDLVKTMSVRPPSNAGRVRLVEIAGLDLQACGGTHVSRTGEIGPVAVRKIESKGRQNRRIVVEFAG